MKAVIVKIERTCSAFPTQYEGTLDNGKMFYFRFRWGELCISESISPTEDIDDAIIGTVVLEIQTDDDWNGVMSPEQVVSYLSPIYQLSAEIRNEIFNPII
ncbi:hypothetical protein [Chitinophaga pinensis]|uniref:Uncharacterized protein n=1 Tax=Chitinophaga pinensis (strain ATCC 43595 / DSM 2588 / LMG 13176 / NBRC 15968 / NCIMB 11800 / UQM 2034) TaxID=485918 RepID=A0A979G9R8_CHIPD|nr:hypothetical protein [Chitinophaga pinensis]ACU63420.1 hypothetical protein Cpin_6006 [Chitinophaga pinensis DSM 2588]